MAELDNMLFDVVVIGGGINGCACAADAPLRGLSVLLCEQDDLASKTSSSSTKLIHGGLRYLEYFDFPLVKKSLQERRRLLKLAPHLVNPLPIFLPQTISTRPAWLLKLGLFIYDNLTRHNGLPKSRRIHRDEKSSYLTPLSSSLNNGFLFYDCTTDDARLTIANAIQAREHGATILTQTALIHAETQDNQWVLTLETKGKKIIHIKAKAIINAAGPWVEPVNKLLSIPLDHAVSLIKGSHIVVNKLYEGNHAYMLQDDANRIVFVVPYHGFSLIGTTEVPVKNPFSSIEIEASEINYLLNTINHYFDKKLQNLDVINSWSGVRQLISVKGKNMTALSRDYLCDYENQPAPSVTLFGGKITTYRRQAETALNLLRPLFPDIPDSHTPNYPLPGATLDDMCFEDYKVYAKSKYHWLDHKTLERYIHSYGTKTETLLNGCKNLVDLGICFADTLYQVEVDYLIHEEWARTVEDVIWRRTKLGLCMMQEDVNKLTSYFSKQFTL